MADLLAGGSNPDAEAQKKADAEAAKQNDPQKDNGNGTTASENTIEKLEKKDPRVDYSGSVLDEDNGSSDESTEATVEQDYTRATSLDPRRQMDQTGVYLDDVERKRAEVQRAAIEGREPDLENPPAYAGDVVQPTEALKSQFPGDVIVEPDFSHEVPESMAVKGTDPLTGQDGYTGKNATYGDEQGLNPDTETHDNTEKATV